MNNTGENTDNKQDKKRKGVLHFLPFSFLKGSPVPEEQKQEDSLGSSSKLNVIPFFTSFNDFAIQLSLFAEVVPEHRGAIQAKKRWSLREPLTVVRGKSGSLIKRSQRSTEEVTEEELDTVEDFICNINAEGEDIKDILGKGISDVETVGNGYIELIRGSFSDGEKFFYVKHHDATTGLLLRNEEGVVDRVGFSPDWSASSGFGNKKAEVLELPLYRGENTEWKEFAGAERSVIHLKDYSTGRFFYGLPSSIACLLAQKIGFEISRHNLDRLENDFFPRLFFEFFNTDGMSTEKQTEHLKALINTFTKKNKKDRYGIFAQYNEGTESKTAVHKLEMDNKGDFIKLDEKKRQDILTAHNTHPILAGVPVTGSLGSGNEIREIFELFNNTVITPIQNFFTDKLLTPIMREASLHLEEMEDLSLVMATSSPLAFMGDLDINSILTINEGRAAVGVPELKTEAPDGELVEDPRGNRIINDDPVI